MAKIGIAAEGDIMTRHPDSMTHIQSGSVNPYSNVMFNPPHTVSIHGASVLTRSCYDFCGLDLFDAIPDSIRRKWRIGAVKDGFREALRQSEAALLSKSEFIPLYSTCVFISNCAINFANTMARKNSRKHLS